MKQGFRQSMAWLHTWSGLIVGWVLFAVFVTGTATYYRAEISRWMQPELTRHATIGPETLAASADLAVAHLQAHAGHARTWFVGLPTPERPLVELFWRNAPGTPPGHVLLDPQTGAPAALRATRGGEFFYRFHFELNLPPLWGRWIVGICAMVMLVALVSGIVTHRRIVSDFFTLRRDKAAQRGWLDAHNVSGVLALPFHLMITYTGVVTLAVMYMPWGVTTAYKGDAFAYYAETGQITKARPPAGEPGTLAPVGPMVAKALATVPEKLERLTIANPRDANSTVVAVFEEPHGLSHEHPQVAFAGTSGAVVEVLSGGLRPAAKTFTTMVGLHEAHFAGAALRVLFFLCGLMGCAMVGTGLVLWNVARLPKAGAAAGPGWRLVQALNLGTIAGLPAGIAAYFLANRLLPLDLGGRAEWEVRVFFAAWIAVALAGAWPAPRQAWRGALGLVACLFVAVVLADIATARTLWDDPAWFLGFDAALLALAAGFALVSHKVARFSAPRRARRMADGPVPQMGRA
ncbi:PepSY-associated TM helix domain-containing protein [Methylobacterium aquaticum]|uniref:PepSY-associated TM helix domain-containing protein n=1 Tax=Methylobacterium aquaticum TaxID=270351 RepID=UPI0019322314|nr:PepSY-associated TM helix domain-containing protein [Methylobacterium aquaticum]QRE72927.1 PepSY domain-containing protein [Methylobacterium aquaticum]